MAVQTGRQRFMIGVAGDSGAGKSTFVRQLAALLGRDDVTVVDLDNYHSLDREERKKLGVTALHPKANDFGRMIDDAWRLRRGDPIPQPVYDHSTGRFGRPVRVQPKPIVVLEGLHPLYLEQLRNALDLRVYFDTDPALKLKWKVQRDSAERGYTPAEVLAEIERRRDDVQRYIEPQKLHADLVITYLPPACEEERALRVRITERAGRQQRLVKWLALADRLRLLPVHHSWDQLGTDPAEVAELAGETPVTTLVALLEMAGEGSLLRGHLESEPCDPVALCQLLLACQILTAARTTARLLWLESEDGAEQIARRAGAAPLVAPVTAG